MRCMSPRPPTQLVFSFFLEMKPPREILDEMKQRAYSQHNLPYTHPAPLSSPTPAWTLPIRISITETAPDKPIRVVSEVINYKLGDPLFTPRGVAARVRHDLGLSLDADKAIEDQIAHALKLYRQHQGQSGSVDQKLVHLSIFARKDDEVFVDELDWDLNEPLNTAVFYTSSVCSDLGLDKSWFETICYYVQGRLDELNEDLLARPHIVDLLPPPSQVLREEPIPAEYPRIEAYDAGKDGEAERQRGRMRALKAGVRPRT